MHTLVMQMVAHLFISFIRVHLIRNANDYLIKIEYKPIFHK